MRKGLLVLLAALLAGGAWAADPLDDPELLEEMAEPQSAMVSYLKERRLSCMGDGQRLAAPVELELVGERYSFDGVGLRRLTPDPDGALTLGVLGAVKDFSPDTREALGGFFDQFEKEGVDALVLLGDLAATESEITRVLLLSARRRWPVLALIGNTEGRAAFNRAVLQVLKVAPNVVNLDIVRRVDLGSAVLLSLPGYLDRAFVHESSGCTYKPADVSALTALLPGDGRPVVLLSHGPPAGSGPQALDLAVEAGHVGDARLTGWLREQHVNFGLFSHILEAGGRGIDAAGAPVRAGQPSTSLYLNVGSANPLAWQLLGGRSSCGMAAVVRLVDGKASHRFIERPCR